MLAQYYSSRFHTQLRFAPLRFSVLGFEFCGGDELYIRALRNFVPTLRKEDLAIFWEFLEKECSLGGMSYGRKLKYVRTAKRILGLCSKPLSEIEVSDVENHFLWLKNNENYSNDTKKDYWNMFKKFVRCINSNLKFDKYKLQIKKKKKLPEDILSEEDIKNLIQNAETIRNKSLVHLLYESGCRVGELTGIRVKDLVFDDFGGIIRVDGKTGMRRIRLINSVPLLAQYLQEHKFRKDPNAPLFYRNDKKTKTFLTSRGVSFILRRSAKKSEIVKKIYPHLLRHSRATHLAKHLTEQELKVYFGWVGDSKMAATYVHLSEKDIEDKILQINGIIPKVENANGHTKPKKCPRCNNLNDYTAKYCFKCGVVMDIKESLDLPEKNDFEEFMVFYKKWKEKKIQ